MKTPLQVRFCAPGRPEWRTAVPPQRRAGQGGGPGEQDHAAGGDPGTSDIAEAVTRMGHKLARSEVRMPAGPLRSVGEHSVALHLHTDIDVSLIVNIVAEEQG